jgi:hypothetical protein
MRGTTASVMALCALALGACNSQYGSGSRPPANHAFLDMYDRPPARARTAKKRVPASDPVEMTGTVGATTAAAELRPYSPEWWERERAREQRENERLRRAIQICSGC